MEDYSNGPWVRFIRIVFSIYYVQKLAQTTLGSVYYNCFFYIICSEAGSNGPWVRFIIIVFSIYYVQKLAQMNLGFGLL